MTKDGNYKKRRLKAIIAVLVCICVAVTSLSGYLLWKRFHVEIEEPEQDDGKLTKILAIVFVLGVGGAGAFFYFYIYKPKQSEPEVSKENLEYEALPTKNEDEQDAETEE